MKADSEFIPLENRSAEFLNSQLRGKTATAGQICEE